MWTDKLIDNLDRQYQVINDSKTPSGRVHVGSLRGVLIHDAVYRALQSRGIPGIYIYGIDDYDPMDGLPADAPDSARQYMGKPLCDIPAPDGSDATDMADHYIREFLDVFHELGVSARIYRMRDVYRSGYFNQAIDAILRNAHKVRAIYQDISGARRPDHWLPFQVICERCGKIGTTEVSNFDGRQVHYHCKPDLVTWAQGCDHRGRISPFNGNGKLPWKLEWAAKWHELGITIEGAGKDHSTKGGSRDVAERILRQLFRESPPRNIPYEFFLVQGAKMSSSKGLGASARDMADFLPPEILRFLMIRTEPKKTVNFATDGPYMLKTFNEHDRLLDRLLDNAATPEDIALLRFAESDPVLALHQDPATLAYAPISFQLITSLLQIPHVDLHATIRDRLGRQPTQTEARHLEARIRAARYWLDHIAQDQDKFQIQDTLPAIADHNTPAQRWFLQHIQEQIPDLDWREDILQTAIFETARLTPLPAKAAFEALYRLFLAKQDGPRAGALLSYLDRDFVFRRLEEAGGYPVLEFIDAVGIPLDNFLAAIRADQLPGTIREIQPEIYTQTGGQEESGLQKERNTGLCAFNIITENKGRRAANRVIHSRFQDQDNLNAVWRDFQAQIPAFLHRLADHGVPVAEIDQKEVRGEIVITVSTP
uniref:Lysine--tRNA ligase n=1 Tax=Candidatus Kentrum sp. MB TaxID=2138164 RepID=A0A451B7Y2_9GAMM|nr:MAG: lysyl-tRNA synthetase, class I [Candidatus Kentron sp. MB]VFK27679.1 MAG: lysyl-tRNA synthetase, class I [Candidatus Kentron sp. MB]VFK74386.1 MAG: lysyl-tRNA synthetase, class I [Candidatus Kentron sp. MB]